MFFSVHVHQFIEHNGEMLRSFTGISSVLWWLMCSPAPLII